MEAARSDTYYRYDDLTRLLRGYVGRYPMNPTFTDFSSSPCCFSTLNQGKWP